ncbi:MAG: hypothetical protein C4537_00860 [Acholeplasma sp.]|jgi:tetratricopeptide (TPR) repeat protein|nr:MAG: hypothetical protein C4537_00860 [Acholeplasma sp.]
MFSLKKLLLGEKTRLFMMVIIFIVFIVFTTRIILQEPKLLNQILYFIIMGFFAFFFVLSEVLRFVYQKGIEQLVIKCNPEEALILMNKLKKIDIIKGYQQSILVFKSLYYRDLGQFDQLDALINDATFQHSASLKLVKKVNEFYLSLQNNDLETATKLNKEINDIYLIKTKKRYSARPVYSLNQLNADYYLAKNNLSKAYDALREIHEESLNPREKTYYYISYAKYYQLKKQNKEELMLKQAKELGPNLAHVKHYQ